MLDWPFSCLFCKSCPCPSALSVFLSLSAKSPEKSPLPVRLHFSLYAFLNISSLSLRFYDLEIMVEPTLYAISYNTGDDAECVRPRSVSLSTVFPGLFFFRMLWFSSESIDCACLFSSAFSFWSFHLLRSQIHHWARRYHHVQFGFFLHLLEPWV